MIATCTPRGLLGRGELEIGESVWLDSPLIIRVARVNLGDPPFSDRVHGLYYAIRHQDWDTHANLRYLHADGTWHGSLTIGSLSGDPPREAYPGYFDSLPELLDALYVATLSSGPAQVVGYDT